MRKYFFIFLFLSSIFTLKAEATIDHLISFSSSTEITSFKGGANQCKVWLTWESVVETNISHFEIHRSINGKEFFYTTSTLASGKEKGNNYYFEENAISSNLYYKLKMINLDGSFQFSEVVNVSTFCEKELENSTMFPSTVHFKYGRVHFIPKNKNEGTVFNLFNKEGKLLYQMSIDKGAINMDLSGLDPGKYYVKGMNGDLQFVDELVIKS